VKTRTAVAAAFAVIATAAVLAAAGADPAPVSPRVAAFLRSGDTATIRAWVYLEARQGGEAATLSPRSIDRRVRRSRAPLTDAHDRPVDRVRIQDIAATGATIRHASRYLNAVSVEATRDQLMQIRVLDGVRRVTRVASGHRRPPKVKPVSAAPPTMTPSSDAYGPSRRQVEQIGVIPLHDDGYHGEGILIGVFDTGFNRAHEALDHVNVVAEWDFIFDDSVTSNEGEDVTRQHSHGTNVLSTLAGYAPGNLIGPAWAADVVLAKTEREFEEEQGEEDDFVRALEWADSIGVDLVTSSLGYYDWYTYEDIDGNTAVTTIACDIAASKGITVVTSAGNNGPLPWPGIIAPADGDSVIAVGAVDSFGVVVSFSSRGPTYDGRIKPDVMAMGQYVQAASAYDSLSYFRPSGTSFSAPLVAGACALLLQVHPEWGPADVLAALRSEASNASSPDNNYGWGIIDTYQSSLTGATGVLSSVALSVRRLAAGVSVNLTHAGSGALTVDLVRREMAGSTAWGAPENLATDVSLDSGSVWQYLDDAGAGVYEYRVQLAGDPSQATQWQRVTVPFAFSLAQSAPNPFRPGRGDVTIRFSLDGDPSAPAGGPDLTERVEVTVYDVRGALVQRLFSQPLGPGDYQITWSGRNGDGRTVASGVYFYKLSAGSHSITRKMVVLRP
jgi:hypothetical protein